MTRKILFVALLTTAIAPVACFAAVEQATIDDSIKKGIELLWAQQKEDGSWDWGESEARKLGITSLAALALYENGVPASDPRLRKALDYVRQNSPRNKDAYSVSLATVLLARIGSRRDRALVRTLAVKIADGQHLTGGWHYTIPETPDSKALRGTSMGDLSVSQFAVLALWQAQRIGAPVQGSFERIRQRLAWAQTPTGGWGYYGLPDVNDTASMTTAGAFMWVVSSAYELKEARRRNDEKVAPREPRRRDPFKPKEILDKLAEEKVSKDDLNKKLKEQIARPVDLYDAVAKGAFERKRQANVAAKGDEPHKEGSEPGQLFYEYEDRLPPVLDATAPSPLVSDKPLEEALKRVGQFAERVIKGNTGHYFYYLWSVERLGVLLGMETFGKANWFELGAESLLKRQQEDGSWGTKPEDEKDPNRHQYLADTAFSLLFLKKANLGSDVTRLLNPDPEHAFWIDGTEERYETLAEAIKAAKPEATIVVHGDGPYPTAGLVVDKPVTIQSAQGYDPVFRYEVPKNEFGFPIEYKADSPERNMFIIRAEKVTFEGLRIQMDPPRRQGIAWAAIYCDKSPIRLLNCTISESERQGTVGLKLVDSQRVFIRNTMFNGFQPSIAADIASRCNLMLRDSLLYGPEAIRASGDGSFNLWLLESTAHVNKLLDLGELKGGTYIIAENNVLRADELIANLGPSNAGRAWQGRFNLFDVRTWVSKGSSAATAANSLEKWREFWKAEESRSVHAKAPFEVPRIQLGPYRHDLSPLEWGVDDDAVRSLMTMRARDEEQIGANVFVVGAGQGYLQFRERLDYENWLSAQLPSERANTAQQ